MTCHLILVSHALTQWNVDKRIQGHTDVPLNPKGVKMAGLLAQRLEQEPLDAIYTSDLERAWQTAEPVAARKGLEIVQDIRLREGRSIRQERSATYPTLAFDKEVETEAALLCRIRDALSDIARSHDGQTVLVVTHGGALDFFISWLLAETGQSRDRYLGVRMALNFLAFSQGQWQCRRLNDAAFLDRRLQSDADHNI